VLTLCHEVRPLTTGAFIAMKHAVRKAGLADRVIFTEISVDPWRDSPARLRAFARYTGIDPTPRWSTSGGSNFPPDQPEVCGGRVQGGDCNAGLAVRRSC